MDGRRHSVDLPISKTLVALRRVRSLRDPSTLSMSKFSALVDNVNWETSSSHGISLRFLESCQDGGSSKHRGLRPRNGGLYGGGNDHIDELELVCDFGKPKWYDNSGHAGNMSALSKRNSQAEGLAHRRSYEDDIYKKKSLSERYCSNQIDKTCVIPSINPLEGVDSSNEPSMGSLQERIDHIASSQRKFESKYQVKSFGAVGSPCTSLRDALSSCSLSLLANEEVDVGDDDDDVGCGISCCWSGTPRFREANCPDVEKNPLLSRDVDGDAVYQNRCLKYNCNEIVPQCETPRSLNQKFRPKSFSELVGQNVVARSLLGAILKGRVTSLYLFHGPRGTGKTSASRIFAAALNCLSLDEQRPCGLCRECVVFFSGRSRDVKEVDSVRINRRDKIRSLIKNATVPPVSSRFKVFIIDECHLLHGETWASVLHSLDSFSQHVIFVMITPELDKLPRSAVSRSQRYHFPKIKDSDISSRLAKICAEEGLDFDEVALDFIASKSSGSMRDAEMMLDQLSLLCKKITISLAYELIGVVSDDELLDLLDLAMSSDTSRTVIRARELMRSRIDPMQLISQLANLIMDILAGSKEGCSEVRRRFSSRHTSEVDLQKLNHALKILSETEKQLRLSKNQTTWLTVALLQLSSLECSSAEVNESKFWLDSTHDREESLKQLVKCSCDDKKSHKLGRPEDCKRTLESIWKRATELCQSTSLRNFLIEQGKLSSLLFSQGVAVAELEFCHPDCVSKAEKSQKLIAKSLQSILGCNIDIRINLVPYASKSTYAKVKKASLNLFGCSRSRKSLSSIDRGSDSEYSEHTSERPIISDRSIIPYHCGCALQMPNKCCESRRADEVRSLGNGNGNALSTRTASSQMSSEDNTPTPVLASASSNEHQCEHRSQVLSFQEHETRPNCFPSFRLHKKSRSSDATQMGNCLSSDEQNKLALSIMRQTSFEASVATNDSNIFYNTSSVYANSYGDEKGLKNSEALCWRTPNLHLKKAWRSRHRRENSHSVGWVLPCAGNK